MEKVLGKRGKKVEIGHQKKSHGTWGQCMKSAKQYPKYADINENATKDTIDMLKE